MHDTSANTGDAVADLEYLLDRCTDHALLPDYMLKLAAPLFFCFVCK